MSNMGHNSVNKDMLKKLITRIEVLEDEKSSIVEDVKEVYTEAKGKGFDVASLRRIIKMRKADREKLREQKEVDMMYLFAIDPELADVLS